MIDKLLLCKYIFLAINYIQAMHILIEFLLITVRMCISYARIYIYIFM